jgi:hypothetical protein
MFCAGAAEGLDAVLRALVECFKHGAQVRLRVEHHRGVVQGGVGASVC